MDSRFQLYNTSVQRPGPGQWQASQSRLAGEGASTQSSLPSVATVVYDQSAYPPHISHHSGNDPLEVRPILPLPAQILRSQDPSLQCPVCARFGCSLVSHMHFVNETKTATSTNPTVQSAGLLANFQPLTISPGQTRTIYPVPMDAERSNLLSMWHHPFSQVQRGPERHLFPVKFIDLVLPAAINHASLFQALLALSASLGSSAVGQIDEIALRHQQLASQMLSETCTDEVSASNDKCILAALLVTITFIVQGNATEADRHMSGINHLVMLRGGPHYLELSGVVADTLLYADYMHSVFFDRPLVWEMPLPALELGPSTSLGRGFDTALNKGDLGTELVRGARSICSLTELFGQAMHGRPTPKDLNAAGYISAVGEFQLTRCNNVYHGTTGKNECVCLALLLFNHVVLRDSGSLSPFVRRIEYQLWTCVQSSERLGVWASADLELFAWILIIGTTTEIRGESKWRPQAVERLKRIRKKLRLATWDDVKLKILDQYCWLGVAQEDTFRAIWTQEVISSG